MATKKSDWQYRSHPEPGIVEFWRPGAKGGEIETLRVPDKDVNRAGRDGEPTLEELQAAPADDSDE